MLLRKHFSIDSGQIFSECFFRSGHTQWWEDDFLRCPRGSSQIRSDLRNLVCELPSTLEVLRLHAKSLDLNLNMTEVQMMEARILKHKSHYFMRLFERHTQMGRNQSDFQGEKLRKDSVSGDEKTRQVKIP